MRSNSRLLLDRAEQARHENRLFDAEVDLVEAVARCRKRGPRRRLADALNALGQIERDLGHCEEARALYLESVEVNRGVGEPLPLAHTLRHLADLEREAGNLSAAEGWYKEVLAIYRRHRATSPLDLANTLRQFGLLELSRGNCRQSIEYLKEARVLYGQVGVSAGAAECDQILERIQAR